MKKKKSFGQHFLNDDQIAWDIVDSLQLPEAENNIVVEIGPGEGVLTRHLLQRTDINLYAVEIDRRLPAILMRQFPALKDRIINADVLRVPFDTLFEQKPFSIIGNFPYNISSQILFKILEHKDQVGQMVGMFQKEVAERVAAKPGRKAYGVVTVLVQMYYEVEYLITVPPEKFDPPPKVQSAVIRLKRTHKYETQVVEKDLRRVVKQAFSRRRKKLSNALQPLKFDLTQLPEGIMDKRAEALSLEDYILLTKAWVR